jgi:signal transduction histidine kinase
MLEYYHNALNFIRSKIGLKIGLLLFIQIFFIISSLVILSYYQSQMTYLGNSINIAGKERFLTSNLMFRTAEYFIQNNNSDTSNINAAINELESNILTLKHGGRISDIYLEPLPPEFSKDLDNIYQKWILLKTILSNNIPKENQIISPALEGVSEIATTTTITASSLKKTISSQIETDKIIKMIFQTGALPLVNSSNVLVTKLGEYSKESSQYSIFLQRVFALLNIGVTSAFVLYIARKILKPILSLTNATLKIKSGNLNVSVKTKGHDELSILSESFNSMIVSIKNYIKKQNELKKELEKANEELKHRDQLKDEFINIAAHELKTPIQPILGLCELLRDRETNIVRDVEILDIIIRNSKRLQKLTEDVLNVAKIESGNLTLHKEYFNLREMGLEILSDFNQKIMESKKDIQLAFKSDKDNNTTDIIINADRNRLSQVLSNLLNNALNFTTKGSITVIVERKKRTRNDNDKDNDEVHIRIKDTGIGICQDMLPKLFTKFATQSETGTGLGLFISKCIIEMHGGKIWAINNKGLDREKGVGSTFTFSLPIKQ